jgi:hypothetical protein
MSACSSMARGDANMPDIFSASGSGGSWSKNALHQPPSRRSSAPTARARSQVCTNTSCVSRGNSPDARGGFRRRCGRCLAWPHRTHDTGGLRAGHRRPPDRCVGGVLGKRGRTKLGQMAFARSTSANDKPALNTSSKRVSPGGAKGIRTPDPHTASVVRYQLRHSPKSCQSKLHHWQLSFKTAAQASSTSA